MIPSYSTSLNTGEPFGIVGMRTWISLKPWGSHEYSPTRAKNIAANPDPGGTYYLSDILKYTMSSSKPYPHLIL